MLEYAKTLEEEIQRLDLMVLEYRKLVKKADNATNEKDKAHYRKLAEEKHDEMRIMEFGGDKNFKRFSY